MSDVYAAIADPHRRLLLDALVARDGQPLFELCARLATEGVTLSRQAVSQHLAVLEAAGLVRAERDGRMKLHHLDTRSSGRSPTGGPQTGADMPRIAVTSVFVHDQDQALAFYTDTLGFVLKHDVPLGEARWLTVVAPGDVDRADATELCLEPDDHPAAQAYKQALFADGIPVIQLGVDDVRAEHERLLAAGVRFSMPPTDMGALTMAVLEDTCGNLLQLAEYPAS